MSAARGRARPIGPCYSADSHVVEPPDVWTSRVPKRWRDRAPRVVPRDGTDVWVVDNSMMSVVGIQAQAGLRYEQEAQQQITKCARYGDLPPYDAASYVRDLAHDGVTGAVLFPSNAHQAYRCVGGDLLEQIARAYNDWVMEYCSSECARLRPVAMLPIDDVPAALRELERSVAAGAAGALIPVLPEPGRRYDQALYDPLWATAAAMRIPLLMHVGGNQGVRGREPVIDLIRHATKDVHVQASVVTMVLSGVFRRHPDLRIGVVEFGASWMVDVMQQVDRVARRRHGAPFDAAPASQELRRNVFAIFQDDGAAVRWREAIGVRNLLWGNDYPHAESTYPRSQEVLARQLEGLSHSDAERIRWRNAAETFSFATPPTEPTLPTDSTERSHGQREFVLS